MIASVKHLALARSWSHFDHRVCACGGFAFVSERAFPSTPARRAPSNWWAQDWADWARLHDYTFLRGDVPAVPIHPGEELVRSIQPV